MIFQISPLILKPINKDYNNNLMEIINNIDAEIDQLKNEMEDKNRLIHETECSISSQIQRVNRGIQYNFFNLNLGIISKYLLETSSKMFSQTQLPVIEYLCQIIENMSIPQIRNVQNGMKKTIYECYQRIIQLLTLSKFSEQQQAKKFNNLIIQKIKSIQPLITQAQFNEFHNPNVNEIKFLYAQSLELIANKDNNKNILPDLIINLNTANQCLQNIENNANSENANEYLTFQFYYLLLFRNHLLFYEPLNYQSILERCRVILDREFYNKQNQFHEIINKNQYLSMGIRNKLLMRRFSDLYSKECLRNDSHKDLLKRKLNKCKAWMKELILKLNVFGTEYNIYKKLQYSLVNNKLINTQFKKQDFQIQNIVHKLKKLFRLKNDEIKQGLPQVQKQQILIMKQKFISLVKQISNFKRQRGLKYEENVSIKYVEDLVNQILLQLKSSMRKIQPNQDEQYYYIQIQKEYNNLLKKFISQDIPVYLKNKYLEMYSRIQPQAELFHQKYSMSQNIEQILLHLKRKLEFSRSKLIQFNKPQYFHDLQEEQIQKKTDIISNNIKEFKYSLPKLAFIEGYLTKTNIQIQEIKKRDFVLQKLSQQGFIYQRPNTFEEYNNLSSQQKKQFFIHQKWINIQNMNLAINLLKTSIIQNQMYKISSKQEFEIIPNLERKLGEEMNKINICQDKYSNDLFLNYNIQNLQQIQFNKPQKKEEIKNDINELKKKIEQQYQYCGQFIEQPHIKNRMRKTIDLNLGISTNKEINKQFYIYMAKYFDHHLPKHNIVLNNPVSNILQTCHQKLEQFEQFQKQLQKNQIKHETIGIFCDNLKEIEKQLDQNKIEFNDVMNQQLITFHKELNQGNDINEQMKDFYSSII